MWECWKMSFLVDSVPIQYKLYNGSTALVSRKSINDVKSVVVSSHDFIGGLELVTKCASSDWFI